MTGHFTKTDDNDTFKKRCSCFIAPYYPMICFIVALWEEIDEIFYELLDISPIPNEAISL